MRRLTLCLVLAAGCGKVPDPTEPAPARLARTEPPADPLPTPAPVKYTRMTADELLAAWRPNPAAAVTKYTTAGVEVRGTLAGIDPWGPRDSLLDVRGAGGERADRVAVVVKSGRAKAGLRTCKVGAPVVVKARAEGATDATPWLVADEVAPGN